MGAPPGADECSACPGQYCDPAGDGFTCACYLDPADPAKGWDAETVTRGAAAVCGSEAGSTIAIAVWVVIALVAAALGGAGVWWWCRRAKDDDAPDDLLEPLNPEEREERTVTFDVKRSEPREPLGGVFSKFLVFKQVRRGSPYDRAGAEVGIKVLEIDGKPVRTKKDVAKAVAGQAHFTVTALRPEVEGAMPEHGPGEDGEDATAKTLTMGVKACAGRERVNSATLPHHLSELHQKMPKESRHLLDRLSQERAVLKEQVQNLQALFHPPDCEFCNGGSTWGFAAPTCVSPAPRGDGEACLPFGVIMDSYAEYGWTPPITAEELHEQQARRQKEAEAAEKGEARPPRQPQEGSKSDLTGRLRRWTTHIKKHRASDARELQTLLRSGSRSRSGSARSHRSAKSERAAGGGDGHSEAGHGSVGDGTAPPDRAETPGLSESHGTGDFQADPDPSPAPRGLAALLSPPPRARSASGARALLLAPPEAPQEAADAFAALVAGGRSRRSSVASL
eukprot:TRINITY_DN32203_c0_g1_i1.p1 TRINITY_DN32203_c0_g1~~TRINITY_DN32203_c0_g1_i1.p1  ORF type:complete len:508 (+),score=168.34 TRINITY_DN32203_c0_g1_i1:127-1650(+)